MAWEDVLRAVAGVVIKVRPLKGTSMNQTTSSTDSVSTLFERWEGVRQQIYAAEMQLADEMVSRVHPARVDELQASIVELDAQAQCLFSDAMRMLADTPSANDAAPGGQARHR